jgi:hypothetical protein
MATAPVDEQRSPQEAVLTPKIGIVLMALARLTHRGDRAPELTRMTASR